jgi:hypothetical protein
MRARHGVGPLDRPRHICGARRPVDMWTTQARCPQTHRIKNNKSKRQFDCFESTALRPGPSPPRPSGRTAATPVAAFGIYPGRHSHGGRARSSDAREALKGHVAGTVQRLKSAGLKLDAARRRVAKELGKLGVRSERGAGEVTANSVRHWCDVVSADVGRRGLAAYNYDLMFTDDEVERFSAWPSSQAQQKFAVASLADFVRENFPELRGSQKPS